MAKNDNSAALVLGGLAALGMLALASSSRGPTRRTFHDELSLYNVIPVTYANSDYFLVRVLCKFFVLATHGDWYA